MKRTPARASPPEIPTGRSPARQQAAAVMVRSPANEVASMPPAMRDRREFLVYFLHQGLVGVAFLNPRKAEILAPSLFSD